MATMAASKRHQFQDHKHVGTLVDVTSACNTLPLRGNKDKYKHTPRQLAPSFRSPVDQKAFLSREVSKRCLGGKIHSQQRLAPRRVVELSRVSPKMDPPVGYVRLPSESSCASSLAPSSKSVAILDEQGVDSTPSRSRAAITSQHTPRKALDDKVLPPKPSLRPSDSPERRGMLDAIDMTARSLDSRFPPLEPASSPESFNSSQLSPAVVSFRITPSLISSDRSPNSDIAEVIEYGVAKSTSIQSLINSRVEAHNGFAVRPELEQIAEQLSGDTSAVNSAIDKQDRYRLNAPGSINNRRHISSQLVAEGQNGSPSKSSRRLAPGFNSTRRSTLGSTAHVGFLSDRAHALADVSSCELGSANMQEYVSDTVPATVASEGDKPPGEERFRGSQRTSKYGYKIVESSDAHGVIMGDSTTPEASKSTVKRNNSRFGSSRLGRTGGTRELQARLVTPTAKSISNKRVDGDEPKYNKMARPVPSAVNTSVSALKLPTHQSVHPPRTSSLPSSPELTFGNSPTAETKLGGGVPSPMTDVTKIKGVIGSASSPDPTLPSGVTRQVPRASIFSRQTAASAARASLSRKKNKNARDSVPTLSHSRTLSSFSDVGKGMRKFGKKVSKIIPGRRTASTGTTSINNSEIAEECHDPVISRHVTPRRQASRLLTTYENSGMDCSSTDDLHYSVKAADSNSLDGPADRHEEAGSREDKDAWRQAQEGIVSAGDNLVVFTPPLARQRIPNDAGDDEEPPNPPQRGGIQGGHYVENANEDVSDAQRGSDVDDVDDVDNIQGITSEATLSFRQLLVDTDLAARDLMDYALQLEPCPLRDTMIRTAQGLGEGIMRLRQARIQAIQVDLMINNMATMMAENNVRMAAILARNVSAGQ